LASSACSSSSCSWCSSCASSRSARTPRHHLAGLQILDGHGFALGGLVTLGSLGIDALRGNNGGPSPSFIAALPPRYGYVETRRFPGLAGGSASVYVFRDGQGPG
jgi:hypothetical protein